MEYCLIINSKSCHVQQNEWIRRTSEELLLPALIDGWKLRKFTFRGKSYLARDQEGQWEGEQSEWGEPTQKEGSYAPQYSSMSTAQLPRDFMEI